MRFIILLKLTLYYFCVNYYDLESIKDALQGILQVAIGLSKSDLSMSKSSEGFENNEFVLATLMVFSLGLIRKLIERYYVESSNHAQLLVSCILSMQS